MIVYDEEEWWTYSEEKVQPPHTLYIEQSNADKD